MSFKVSLTIRKLSHYEMGRVKSSCMPKYVLNTKNKAVLTEHIEYNNVYYVVNDITTWCPDNRYNTSFIITKILKKKYNGYKKTYHVLKVGYDDDDIFMFNRSIVIWTEIWKATNFIIHTGNTDIELISSYINL